MQGPVPLPRRTRRTPHRVALTAPGSRRPRLCAALMYRSAPARTTERDVDQGRGGAMEITGGVGTLTVTGAAPGSKLRVRRVDGTEVVTLVADDAGNAHLAYVPDEHRVMASTEDLTEALAHGRTLAPGEYTVDGTGAGARRRRPPRPVAVRPGAGRGLRLPRRSATACSCRSWSASPTRTCTARRRGRRSSSTRATARPIPTRPSRGTLLANLLGLRRRRREHARHRLLGRRVRRVQPGPGRRRLRRGRDRRPPALGAARQARHGRPQLSRASPSSTSPPPGRRTWPPSPRCRSSTTCGASSGPAASTTRASPGPGWPCATPRPRSAARPGTQARIEAGDEVAAAATRRSAPRTSTSSGSAGPSTHFRPALSARRIGVARRAASTCPCTSPAPGRTSRPGAASRSMLDDFTSRPTPGSPCSTATTPTATARW